MQDAPLLSAVPRGELRRVLRSRRFLKQMATTAFVASSIHVLVGWGTLANWGRRNPLPLACLFDCAGDHCVKLASEVFVDATLTAFFTCAFQVPRLHEVRAGELPAIRASAFPRGVLALLFPRGLCRRGAAWRGRGAGCESLLAVTFVWGLLWGGLTLALLSVLWAVPLDGQPSSSLCVHAWVYIGARGVWSGAQAVLVCYGSYLLWCTAADQDVQPEADDGPLCAPLPPPPPAVQAEVVVDGAHASGGA